MKSLILIAACIILVELILLISCKKDTTPNSAPVAKADNQIFVDLKSCSDRTASVILDGSKSFDPDSNIVSYHWALRWGNSFGFSLRNADSPIAKLENISSGTYIFDFIVTDKKGLSSSTSVTVTTRIRDHVMDLPVDGNFMFTNSYQYYDYYHDLAEIAGKGELDSLGEFNFHMYEWSDTAHSAYAPSSYITMYRGNWDEMFISGDCSVNFKRLMETGGGAFSGVVTLSSSSAGSCNVTIADLPPLTITGSLDTASKKVTLSLQGTVRL